MNKFYASQMTPTPLRSQIMVQLRDNCWLQIVIATLPIFLTMCYFSVAYIPPEDNPDAVGGMACEYPAPDSGITAEEMTSRWRMTRGDNLVMIQVSNRPEMFEVYLPPGRYTIAYRYNVGKFTKGSFTIWMASEDDPVRAFVDETVYLLSQGWRARYAYLSSPGEIYHFHIQMPEDVLWCMEIAETQS